MQATAPAATMNQPSMNTDLTSKGVLTRINEFIHSDKFKSVIKKIAENVVVATLIGIPGTIVYNVVKDAYLKMTEESKARVVGLLAGVDVMLVLLMIVMFVVVL